MVALCSRLVANSAISLDLPTPASATTVTARHVFRSLTSANAWCRRESSSARPTIGEVRRRAIPGASALTLTRRHTPSGTVLPLSVEWADVLDVDGVPNQLKRGFTDQDLAR